MGFLKSLYNSLYIKYIYCSFIANYATKVINICDKSYKNETHYLRQKL